MTQNPRPRGEELNRDSLTNRVVGDLRTLIGNGETANIMIAGPWGSGKTTLLRMIKREIERTHPNDVVILTFSPWEQTGTTDPRIAFLKFLANRLNSDKTKPASKEATLSKKILKILDTVAMPLLGSNKLSIDTAFLATAGLPSITIPLSIIAGLIKLTRSNQSTSHAETILNNPEKFVSSMEEMRSEFMWLLNSIAGNGTEKCNSGGSKRILLLIDDMDRARPSDAVHFMEMLYHFFLPLQDCLNGSSDQNNPNHQNSPVISVWAVNVPVMADYLMTQFQGIAAFDPYAYLERIFHQTIRVSPLTHVPPTGARTDGKDGDLLVLLNDSIRRAWGNKQTDCPLNLWGDNKPGPWTELTGQASDPFLFSLAKGFNYQVMGNLRLARKVMDDVCQIWVCCQYLIPPCNANPATDDPSQTSATPAMVQADKSADMVHLARLIILIRAFPGFRDNIALYLSMWPSFVDAVNQIRATSNNTIAQHPTFRHADNVTLLQLLIHLGALEFNTTTNRYQSVEPGQRRLACELIELHKYGY